MEKVINLFIFILFFICYFISPVSHAEQLPSDMTVTAKPSMTPNPLSGNFDITSNYIFRGISLTDNLPAFQGGLTYTFFKPGIYLNLWGSNVKFNDAYGDTATVEIETAVGVTNNIGDHFTYDLKMTRYNYPHTAASYNELVTNFTYYFITAQVSYSNNVYDTHGNGTYYNIGIKYDIPSKYIFNLDNMAVTGGVGHYNLPASKELRSYDDYNIQLSKTIANYVLAVQWTDTSDHSSSLTSSHILGIVTVNF